MKKYLSVFNKKKDKKVIGVLSGTSVDAVDVVLLNISDSGKDTRLKLIDFHSYPVKKELKSFILRNSKVKQSSVEDICRLNVMIAGLFSNCIKKLIYRNGLKAGDIDLIGSHGQTIYHSPSSKKIFGYNSKSTLQIGDPSVIANLTGITTVGDFRTADTAVNGDGAPLVPYLDYLLFRHKTKNRAFINIGGISNITILKKNCNQKDVIAFDCGPGNMLIDHLVKRFYGKKFDRNGRLAAKGKINEKLFKLLISEDKFFRKPYPKSTGREYYSDKFIDNILRKAGKSDANDIIATFTKFTAYAIYSNLKNFSVDDIIVSGGGAKNKTLMKFLQEYMKFVKVSVMNSDGINEDNKEAVLFAVLANELVSGVKANLPSVTGSTKNVFLGKICFA